jgi:hypothetical protein
MEVSFNIKIQLNIRESNPELSADKRILYQVDNGHYVVSVHAELSNTLFWHVNLALIDKSTGRIIHDHDNWQVHNDLRPFPDALRGLCK